MANYSLGRVKNPNTARAASLYPVTKRTDFRTLDLPPYRYWWENGAWLDQGPYGTCVGNAFAHRRADGPVRVAGIDEDYAIQLYLDASGDTTLQEGTSAWAACRAMMARGEISSYHWITSPQELRDAIRSVGSICIGIDWYNSMFDPYPKYNNYWIDINYSSGLAGGHELLLNGVNLSPNSGPAFYRLKNSWGRGWGKGGTVHVDCNALEELIFSHYGDAVVITEKKIVI